MKQIIAIAILLAAVAASAQTNVIYPSPTNFVSGGTTCKAGSFTETKYTRTIANGWGWTNKATTLTVICEKTNNIIVWGEKGGSTGCGIGSVTWTSATNKIYRFDQYFGSSTNIHLNAPLTIVGFKP